MPDKSLGQFFTTNANYILQGFEHTVQDKSILDPYAGQGDLLDWAARLGAKDARGLDIDPRLVNERVHLHDSLRSIPPSEMIVTNPPYRFDGGGDQYLVALQRILEAAPEEFIAIVPINFFSYETSSLVRRALLRQYTVSRCNVFKQQVFRDTTINVVAFHAVRGGADKQIVPFHFFPDGTPRSLVLERVHDFAPGGEDWAPVLRASSSVQRVFKWQGPCVVFQCLDTVNARIHAERAGECNLRRADRGWTAIAGDGDVEAFNLKLGSTREATESLCLPNFRDRYRKRLPFDWCYRLWNMVNMPTKMSSMLPGGCEGTSNPAAA